jgi:hypothetical protein
MLFITFAILSIDFVFYPAILAGDWTGLAVSRWRAGSLIGGEPNQVSPGAMRSLAGGFDLMPIRGGVRRGGGPPRRDDPAPGADRRAGLRRQRRGGAAPRPTRGPIPGS